MYNFNLLFNFLFWLLIILIIIIILRIILHPIIIILIIITLNIFLCLNLSIWKSNYIYSFLFFLIIIRGLLIIFIYFSSLISNEQYSYKINYISKPLLLFILNIFTLIIFIPKYSNFTFNIFFYNFKEIFSLNLIFSKKNINISNIYIYPFNNLSLTSIFFILFSFFRIIKINSSSHSYTIRKIINYD